MASNYPTSLDNFTNPSSGASLSSPSHSAQHGDVNDAVEAIEAKLGIGSSAASAAVNGAVLVANGSGTTTYSSTGYGVWTNWTPQLWQGANVTTTVTYAKYTQINKLVIANFYIAAAAAGTAGNEIQVRNLPVAASVFQAISGAAMYLDAGTAFYTMTATGITTTSITFYTFNQGNSFGLLPAVTLANFDYIRCSLSYEAA